MQNIKSVDYIIKARHYGGSARGYIRKMQKGFMKHGIAVTIKDLDGEPTGAPVYARVWQGQWIANCECNSASFVDPEEPVFFCFGCGNRSNGSKPRPVVFPEEWREIEQKLLERPVNDIAGLTDNERAGMAQAVLYKEKLEPDGVGGSRKIILPLTRSWEPGETLADLADQQDAVVRNWHAELKKEKRHGV